MKDIKKVFVTMQASSEDGFSGKPIAAYLTEEAAQAAVAKTKAGWAKMRQLEEHVQRPSTVWASSCQDEQHQYPGEDGCWYTDEETAAAKSELYRIHQGAEYQAALAAWVRREDYYETVSFGETAE